ncbi:MAG: enoyl-CoA hydratase/isomerase family protein [Bacteroidales bacterium]|nr:enoyl-CoA hydratase/isomerase family protein [Bacteroidales bacterium]
MKQYNTIKLNFYGKTCELILNRPDKKNAMNFEMVEELSQCFDELQNNKDINLVLLKSVSDEFFSAGGDLNTIASISENDAYLMGTEVQNIFAKLTKLPQITVACIKGLIMGGGFELCLHADIRIAHENAKFALPELRHGMIPGAGGISLLARVSGISNALWVLASGKQFSAEEALRMGIVQTVESEENYANTLTQLSNFLENINLEVISTAKHLAWMNLNKDISECLNAESKEFGSLLNRFGRKKIEEFMANRNSKK